VKSEAALGVRPRVERQLVSGVLVHIQLNADFGIRGSWRPMQHSPMKQTVQSLFGDWREVQEVLMRPMAATAIAGNS
jgi:hypothetical protein